MNKTELKALRLEMGLSVKDTATALGIHYLSLYRYESGKTPIPPLLARAILQLRRELGKGDYGIATNKEWADWLADQLQPRPHKDNDLLSQTRIQAYAEGLKDGRKER